MSEIIAKARQTTAILADQSLASAQRAPLALQTMSGLVLSDLSPAAQVDLEAELVFVQRILNEVPIAAAEDYETLSGAVIEKILQRIETASRIAIDSETQRVMSGLDAALHRLPREEIAEVRRHPEEFVPLLIEAVEAAVAMGREGSQPEGQSHFFAAFLLVELKVTEAVPLLVDGFKLHGNIEAEIFGDAVHSLFPRMLAILADGETEQIDQIIRERSLNEFTRWGALSAYRMLVGDGVLRREETIAKLESHLAWCVEREDEDLIAPIICELGDLGAREAWKTIETAFDRNLVNLGIVSQVIIESQLADPADTLRKTFGDYVPSSSFDTIEELSGWASFQEPAPIDQGPLFNRPPSDLFSSAGPRFDSPVEVEPTEPVPTGQARVGRNEPCPCGSGKKFKKCCRG